jgi:CMP-N,N'-diacetyllegionaminic acid synthase
MRIVGRIPARGGSKGIACKNFSIVGENSLISIKVLQAKAINCHRIWGSIEDLEIGDLAQEYGAGVINGPNRVAEDFTDYDDVLIHAIESLELTPDDLAVM